jgi:hypothetical protein
MADSQKRLPATWAAFLRALRSAEPFNPFPWIYRLSSAAAADCSQWANFRLLLPMIPIFAISLVCFVTLSYFLSIRDGLVRQRWCSEKSEESCAWMPLHDATVFYLATMVLYNYVQTMFSSPGVALADNAPDKWMARNGQGGFLGWDPKLDKPAERHRVSLYGPLDSQLECLQQGLYPSPTASRCQACQILRPPRCHHCRQCNRCILAFDHHCVWLNNCIGYNNYRSFFLSIFFLAMGSWYAVFMLFWPFYEPMRAQINEHGFKWLYSNGTGLLDLPPLLSMPRLVITGQLTTKMVVDMVYPLCLGIGAIMSGFAGFHFKYIVKARTTLEHRVILEHSVSSMLGRKKSSNMLNNPFDQGWYRNMIQILGPNLLLVFLPVPVTIPPPYAYHATKIRKSN